ncbi:MAG: hypothetical protein ACE5EQ_10955 [Phycisphaerae bacterium]
MRIRAVGLGIILSTGLTLGLASETIGQGISAGGFQRFLFRGAEFAGNPLFLSNPQNGPLFNFEQFAQRVEYDRAADGYTYEFFRFFGPDSFGNVESLDLGPFKLELGPDSSLGQSQLVGFHGRTGFTSRFIPEIFFQGETGQRGFNQFSGVTTFTKEPLRYRASFNTGIQDFEWTGNMSIDSNSRINILGFYDFNLRLVNVGNFESNGVVVHDEQVTDFDTGPISLSGHIGLDLIASLFQADGATDAATAPRIFSAAAQRERTADELFAALETGEKLTDEEVSFLVEQMFLTAFRTDPLGVILNGMPATVPGFERFSLEYTDEGSPAAASEIASPVPEPGTLLLVAAAAGLSAIVRPMRRRRKSDASRYG